MYKPYHRKKERKGKPSRAMEIQIKNKLTKLGRWDRYTIEGLIIGLLGLLGLLGVQDC